MATGKKILRFVLLAIFVIGAFVGWRLFSSNTGFSEKTKRFFVKTGSSFNEVMASLEEQQIVTNPGTFRWVAEKLGYDKNVKAGRYDFKKGASIFDIIRRLRSGRQTPVRLVINKLRTREDLAGKLGSNFECDSSCFMEVLNNKEALREYGLDTNSVMTAIIPNSYDFLWNTPAQKVFKKLYEEQEIFWNDTRKKKAAGLNLTPAQVYTLASIVEEESNFEEDKGKIASVYLNRLETGMRLAADPTVKFALRDFGMKRIYHKHLQYESPYNTYRNAGLPPGPICTPSVKTIDAVLNSPSTSYLYFVAKPDLKGHSNFATTYQEHLKYANQYRLALDSLAATNQMDSSMGQ